MGRTGRVYRRVRSRFISRPTSFGWVLDGRLAASGLPSSRAQLRWLRSHGVDTVLTLTETPLPAEWLDSTTPSVRHVRMVDHDPPSQERLDEAVRFIDSELGAGRAVLVHCLAGVGRTGSVLAAYMISTDGLTADQALARLRAMRPGSVERAQEAAVREYERRVRPAKR
ncbi:MAG: dual specificity protein phosphatase family protein [Nitrososphaerales archaeon]